MDATSARSSASVSRRRLVPVAVDVGTAALGFDRLRFQARSERSEPDSSAATIAPR